MLNPKVSRGMLAALLCCTGMAASSALAQNFPETEPNDTKFANNAVGPLAPGNTITGNSTGTSTTTAGATSSDNYLVTVAAPPTAGIWRYRLVLTTTGTAGHVGSIRGLTQTAGVITAGTDTAFQTSSSATTPARFNQWYGLGASSHQLFYRVTGTTSTTADYVATLERQAVTPVPGPADIIEGNVTISTIGQTSTDTDLWVYDSNFNPIPTFGNDDESAAGGGTGGTLQSRVTRALTPGTYYVAISNFAFANDQPSPTDDDFQLGAVMDFPNVATNSSTSTNVNVNLAITGGSGTTTPVALTRAGAFDVVWLRFQVVPLSSPTNPSGVGTATPTNVSNSGTGTTTLAVTVTPGTNPASTAHTVTVTSPALLGGSILLRDNGIFPDTTAGDNIFTGSAAVVGGTTPGAVSLPYVIQEVSPSPLTRSANGNIAITVIPPPPSNDECFNATVVSTGTTTGDNSQSTSGTTVTCATSSRDVWYSFTSASGGSFQFDTEGSTQVDTVLALFDACGGTELACDDDGGTGNLSSLVFNLAPNQTVFVRVASFGGSAAGGGFTLNISSTVTGACCAPSGTCTITTSTGCIAGVFQGDNTTCVPNNCPQPQPPTNDTCATAIIVSGTASGTIDTLIAQNEDAEPIGTCNSTTAVGIDNSIWFQFTPGSDGTLSGTVNTGTYDGFAVLLSGGPCGSAANFTELACWDFPDDPMDLSFPDSGSSALTAGVTYYLVVGDWGATDGGGATAYDITVPGGAANGRCCIGARCAIVAPAQCVASGTAQAVFTASATDCNASGVNTAPCCFADYNKAGGVTVQDIFDFLTDYFTGSVNANVGGDGTTLPTVQDIFDYLTAYFAGGC